MIKVGISGNRYSGTSYICRLFNQISIPVFDADIVLKFIISHDLITIDSIKAKLGDRIFTNGYIDPLKVKTKKDFDIIIDCAEYSLMKAYENFSKKNKHSIYTIFNSAMLYERGWNENMKYNISVFCPKVTRMERCKEVTKLKVSDIAYLLRNELDDTDKNKLGNFVIHNYEAGDPLTQVNDIDQRIIDKYLKSEQTEESIVLTHY
jgi:dephospho-CoA kinase